MKSPPATASPAKLIAIRKPPGRARKARAPSGGIAGAAEETAKARSSPRTAMRNAAIAVGRSTMRPLAFYFRRGAAHDLRQHVAIVADDAGQFRLATANPSVGGLTGGPWKKPPVSPLAVAP